MNAEITITQRHLLNLYAAKVAYLRAKPRQFLNDLQHEALEIMRTPQPDKFSLSVAAQINHAACTMILEEGK